MALLLAVALVACTQRQGGAVAMMRSQDGGLSVAVAWCGPPPRLLSAEIEVDQSWKPVAKFSTIRARGDFAAFDLRSPGPDWTLRSGDPRLVPGVTYYLEAWPDSGKKEIFGQSVFTLADIAGLKPGQIYGGNPGQAITKGEFIDKAKQICG